MINLFLLQKNKAFEKANTLPLGCKCLTALPPISFAFITTNRTYGRRNSRISSIGSCQKNG
ncbi:MAG: hypothetical protein PWP18_229 [Thermoanaerobacter sp.]|jgi:hypothetical protein|nr:hypothetical protein [Thermosipho sp. (in: thermotogales)]MDK2814316.1 hypothetical protein [Thermoanaerobacter sp.]MDK2840126.1 hypothetical protein [Thermosipho sp. (in: thermotogales)]